MYCSSMFRLWNADPLQERTVRVRARTYRIQTQLALRTLLLSCNLLIQILVYFCRSVYALRSITVLNLFLFFTFHVFSIVLIMFDPFAVGLRKLTPTTLRTMAFSWVCRT